MNRQVIINIQSNPQMRELDDKENNYVKWEALSVNDLKVLLSAKGLSATGGKIDLLSKLNDYENWNKFTMKELKNELGNRSLPISGSKDELIQRLIEGGKTKKLTQTTVIVHEVHEVRDEAPKKKQKRDVPANVPLSHSFQQIVPQSPMIPHAVALPVPTPQYIPPYKPGIMPQQAYHQEERVYQEEKPTTIPKTKKRIVKPSFDTFINMTIYELKAALSERSLKVSGNKEDLLSRLLNFEKLNSMTVNELEEELRDRRLPLSGNKRELIDRITSFDYRGELTIPALQPSAPPYPSPVVFAEPFYQEARPMPVPKAKRRPAVQSSGYCGNLTINDLKSLLSQRGLKVSGNKDELMDRLQNFEELNSLTMSELEEELHERGLPLHGSKRDAIDLITAFEDLSERTVAELKDELSSRHLPCTGLKDDLVVRLLRYKSIC